MTSVTMYEIEYPWELDGDVRLTGTARVTFEFHANEDVDIIRVLAPDLQLYGSDFDGPLSRTPIALAPMAAVGLGRVIEVLRNEEILALCLERGREATAITAMD